MNAAGRLSLYGAGVVVAFGGAFGIAAAVVPDSAVANWTAAADDSSMADHAGMTGEERRAYHDKHGRTEEHRP